MDVSTIIEDSFRQSDFLLGITESHAIDILNRGIRIHLKSGEYLFHQGDRARKCFFVLNGRMKLIKLHEQGKEAIIRYIGPGELTAILSVFKGKDYPVTAETIGPTEAVGWDKQTMEQLMLKYPPLAVNMLRCTIDRLDELQNRYLEICTEQVEQRIARALLRIMKQSGLREEDGIRIDFPLSRQELADYIGTTIFTVSRILSTWEKKGWIKSKREQITVCDPHSLVLFSEHL
ncbi:MAG: Crp/Fnr family transcriptional regulator [Deltaproteobacteria bacterium]|nr:Crp/Fnr family transcriptional regulator [Deltaproteobacteria bacterium]